MSATDPETVPENVPKKRRQRACDMCRRRKRDGGDVCDNCNKSNLICTYAEPAAISMRNTAHIQNSPPASYDNDYIEALKQRLQTVEASLRQLTHLARPQAPLFARVIRSTAKPLLPPDPEDSEFLDVLDSFRVLSIHSAPTPDPGFRGKSSAAMLVKAAVEVKAGGLQVKSQLNHRIPPAKPFYLKPWQDHPTTPSHTLSFPADHLTVSLISLYFSNVNSFIPVLHRGLFEDMFSQQLHKNDLGFGTILLLVCALGSLYLTDTTVSNLDRSNLAWACYNQVELCGQALSRPPTLWDIQAYGLAVQFLHSTSDLRLAWVVAGFGLRLAQDIGFHRHKFSDPISIDEELEKRAFWTLLYLDTQLSGALGRSAVHDPIDLDLTMPCQPANKSSTMAFFTSLINLYRILHFSQRTLYTIHANHVRMDRINDLPHSAAEMEVALDRWFSTIPYYLSWDPERPDTLFFDQSAALFCVYQYTRITIHRPFVPGLSLLMPPDPSALGRCTEAARACIRVADIQRRRRPSNPLIFSQSPLFTSAMMLILDKLINPLGTSNPTADLTLISTAIDIFKNQQQHWPSSGFFLTVLEQLVSTGYLDDHQDIFAPNLPPNVEDALARRQAEVAILGEMSSWPGPASSHAPRLPRASVDHPPPEVAIPPAFVGDEEILPRRIRPPRVI
ncbi:fungal-specific transcription factor domain-containing protein [Mycena olivaceomarginata]|nr:fungal-specific transcription factor domain-containing protein [Mycena olivaceomarginata]